jgi:hypothetical protein
MSACLLALSLFVTACGSATVPSTGAPTREPGQTAEASATVAASSPAGVTPTAPPPTPTVTPDPGTAAPTATAAATPTASADASDDPSPVPGAADACSGSDQNRTFFAQVAAAVTWDVYCAVLPSGWFVEDGSYRLAGGGRLEITYAGPNGARLALSQGAFCPDASGCVPAGSQRGEAPFADRMGTVIALDGGGTAMIVDRGAIPSWLLVATGLGETQALEVAASLVAVEG